MSRVGRGERMSVAYTRAVVHTALNGTLRNAPTRLDPIFNLAVPIRCPNVPDEVFDPRTTWADLVAYDR